MRDLYIALSGAMAQEKRLAIISDNLANSNTVGFKKSGSVFSAIAPAINPSVINRSVTPELQGQLPPPPSTPFGDKFFAQLNHTYVNHQQGELSSTDNGLDFAIIGEGFFVVDTPQGERYTRAGNFILNREGFLTTQDGYEVQGGGGAIQLDSASIEVGVDGVIFQDGSEIDRFRLVAFDDKRVLEKQGKNLYRALSGRDGPRDIIEEDLTQLRQRALEYSNVNMVSELVQMIDTERSYEMAQKAIRTIDQAFETSIGGILRG